MFLRRDAGQRLKPVGIVCRSVFHCPVLHGLRDHVGSGLRQLPALIHNLPDFSVYAFRQPLLHFTESKDLTGKNLFHIQYFTHFLFLSLSLKWEHRLHHRHSGPGEVSTMHPWLSGTS